jgi:hypothetical protein
VIVEMEEGPGAWTVKLEGCWQLRVSLVLTQQFHCPEDSLQTTSAPYSDAVGMSVAYYLASG